MTQITDLVNYLISNPNGPSVGYCENNGEYRSLFLGNPYHSTVYDVEIRIYEAFDNTEKEIPFDFEEIEISSQASVLLIRIKNPKYQIRTNNFEIVINHV